MLTERTRFLIGGVVQGVGFRPLVYRLAQQLELAGFVRNDGAGVTVELEGSPAAIGRFESLLRQDLPAPAHIHALSQESIQPLQEREFVIARSLEKGQGALIPADLAPCFDCLRELRDPADRRYGYALLNCTACGPRYTVIQALPYDRPNTTLRDFPLCSECRREYEDPLDRRFHAQPTACPQCGPQLSSSLETARAALLAGQIVAVKGLGGYHLACRADLDSALHCLRQRKQRPHRPLALMVRNLEVARRWVTLTPEQEACLQLSARPIVVAPARADPGCLAPGQRHLGVMLPYTPLHEMLLEPPLESLVLTSANLPGEPIPTEDDTDFSSLCDHVLGHQRPIAVACEDSVIQWGPRGPFPVRRSRGYAPQALALNPDLNLPPLLAVGAELKNTLAMARGQQAWLSGHIGDLASYETLRRFESTARHLEGLLGFAPELLAADLHPGYLSRRWAEGEAARRGLPLVLVQHHHAHVASLLADHAWPAERPVLAFVFDGTGWGPDGTIWGGEVLRASYSSFERVAFLDPFPLPGGEAAIRSPYRLALSFLQRAGLDLDPRLPCVAAAPGHELRNISALEGPVCSSMGRLFDCVASLLGICQLVTYEGQAASLLEAACFECEDEETLPFELDGPRILWSEALRLLVRDFLAGTPVPRLAARFHNGLADLVVGLAQRWGQGMTIALSGGCFHNQRLLRSVVERLELPVLIHSQVPANDGGLALGQALVAAHQVLKG